MTTALTGEPGLMHLMIIVKLKVQFVGDLSELWLHISHSEPIGGSKSPERRASTSIVREREMLTSLARAVVPVPTQVFVLSVTSQRLKD